MASNKQGSLITKQPAADSPPAKAIVPEPDLQVPIVPAGGAPIEPPVPKTPQASAGKAGKAGDLWSNGLWAVTNDGLESRYVINGMSVDYFIDKARLLQVMPGTAVSMWGPQLAGKSWLKDPEALVAAIAEALRIHHPGQPVVDMVATRDHALREWHRTHDHKGDHDLGWEYQFGEATLRRIERQRAEAKATGNGGGPPHEPWVAPIVIRVRDALARYGVDPSAHSARLDVNERLAAMAVRGATDAGLAAAADKLKEEHILRDEEPEPDMSPEEEAAFETAVEELIDDEIYQRHQRALRDDNESA